MNPTQELTLKCKAYNLKGKLGTTRKFTNQILTTSDQLIELVELVDIIQFNEKHQSKTAPSEETRTPKPLLRYSRYKRVRKNLIQLIEHNKETFSSISNKFITLTFADNFTDIRTANQLFKSFIRKVRHDYPNLQYIACIEFQKRGAIHYHLFTPNLPTLNTQEMAKFRNYYWTHGRSNIKRIKKHQDYLGLYMAKYISKKAFDQRLDGEKAYFTSRGIVRPTTTYDPFQISRKLAKLPKPAKIETYTNKFGKPVIKTIWTIK